MPLGCWSWCRHRYLTTVLAVPCGGASLAMLQDTHTDTHCDKPLSHERCVGVRGMVGGTKLVELTNLSRATKCTILAKAEHLNPSGSVKDRAAAWILKDAVEAGKVAAGGTIVEATGGNTGISLALLGRSLGFNVLLSVPNNISQEKIDLMRLLGARVDVQPIVPFTDPLHYFQHAKQVADSDPNSLFTNQFENLSNFSAHYHGTGPEIWLDAPDTSAFVCSAGTGGTIAGVSKFLKEMNSDIEIALIDPFGSSLFSYVSQGTLDSEGHTTIEGIGIGRITANFKEARIDYAVRGSDQEAIDMAFYLLRNEGLFVGPSAALNVVGAVKVARKLGAGCTVVTVLCDDGNRYRTKMYNAQWLAANGLTKETYAAGDLSFVK